MDLNGRLEGKKVGDLKRKNLLGAARNEKRAATGTKGKVASVEKERGNKTGAPKSTWKSQKQFLKHRGESRGDPLRVQNGSLRQKVKNVET